MRILPIAAAFLFQCFVVGAAFASPSYPIAPSPQLTPGELCTTPTEFRYPERIAYCERAVPTALKDSIIATYDRYHGYNIGTMDREHFKIDHYIPLCAGGSNSAKNLWPQYVSSFEVTDRLEKLVCTQMERGRLKQKDAVEIIRRGKNNLKEVPQIIRRLGAI